eukprot:TRINITY_DN3985_c0_g2_i1.p1 TRINITY_DN3985_c0_g2~~TRINITY_DN3985_c0_g2_i1.p1  ORF type:complete len:189 (-),score=92.27 TRINITY_DN3985_c0_g2_i1:259-825(-)
MAGRTSSQNEKLQTNVEEQLNRLLTQLQDLEDLKDELDEEEYNSTKNDTLQQLKEFEATLKKMISGDVTIVDKLSGIRLALRAAVSEAFRTPEVIRLFANKQPRQLRLKLAQITRGSTFTHPQQALEIIAALKKLGEPLTTDELNFLTQNMTKSLSDFESAADNATLAAESSASVLSIAGTQIKTAQK